MKTFDTILLCLISFNVMQAVNPSRFPINPLARWKITNMNSFPLTSYYKIEEKLEYFIESDTVINTNNYYKLYKSGVAYYDEPFYYEKVYVGAIRDEDNKFFFIKKDQTSDILLFDYNLGLNDTIHGSVGNNHIINKIDSLPDGRKCLASIPEIFAGCMPTITLIEGIGHFGGILEDPPCEHIGFYGNYLNCFTIGDELIYQNSLSMISCDNFFSSVNNFNNDSKINIYPVPAKDKLTVEFEDLLVKPTMLDIYNSSGNLIFSKCVNSDNKIAVIDLTGMSAGIYLIKIADEANYITRPFVIK